MKHCDANLEMWKAKINELQTQAMHDAQNQEACSTMNDSPPLVLPTSPPDVSTMFALSLPTAMYTPNSERAQPSWPDPNSSPLLISSQPDNSDSGNDNGRIPTPTPPDSRSSSPPTHRRHTSSHTQLPHVSIPAAISNSFSSSNSQHAKSSSTASASAGSPLFSARSAATSSSSPRSDISAVSLHSTLGLFRPGLRAAYEANGRPKMKRLENRTSWQGSVVGTLAAMTQAEPSTDPSAPIPPHVPNGS